MSVLSVFIITPSVALLGPHDERRKETTLLKCELRQKGTQRHRTPSRTTNFWLYSEKTSFKSFVRKVTRTWYMVRRTLVKNGRWDTPVRTEGVKSSSVVSESLQHTEGIPVCRTFSVSPEAVRRRYTNRGQGRKHQTSTPVEWERLTCWTSEEGREFP